MMKNEEKLDYLMDLLNISNKDIVNKLEISNSFISQWRNQTYNKLKKIHLYAISKAFDIPIEIFENESIDSKEKIKEYLKTNQNISIGKRDDDVLKTLIGEWYCYNHSSSKDLNIEIWEDRIIIDGDYSIQYFVDNKFQARGEIEINNLQSIIKLKNKK